MWRVERLIIAFAYIVMSGCDNYEDAQRDISRMESQARDASPAERYRLYREVYGMSQPPDTRLLDEVLAAGKSTYRIAVRSAKSGDVVDIGAAIEVINQYNRVEKTRCSPADAKAIKDNISRKFVHYETSEIVKRRVDVACSPP